MCTCVCVCACVCVCVVCVLCVCVVWVGVYRHEYNHCRALTGRWFFIIPDRMGNLYHILSTGVYSREL